MKRSFKFVLCIFSSIALLACSAKRALPGAGSIVLVNELPDIYQCSYLGEVLGSQGNWLTGNYTTNRNLAAGARNDLRNQAFKLGANIVHVQDMKITSAHDSSGTTNTTVIGNAYRCNQ